MIDRFQHLHRLWRTLGPEWLAYRVGYAAQLRSGAMRRRLPAAEWGEQPLAGLLKDGISADPLAYFEYRRSNAPLFLFESASRAEYQRWFAAWDAERSQPVILADEFSRGRLRYFEQLTANTGFPPDWHANPLTGERAPGDRHWSEIDEYQHGDIKIIWEPSRFGFAYALVRAYWRNGNQSYAEMFWRCVEDWRKSNPPQLGPNWKCGQEISLRVMAWCFGLYGFLDAEATTPDRVASLAQAIAVSGARVEANLDYAISQENNHGISEAVGLWTIGLLFPEFRLAEQWRDTGREVLEKLGAELIYEDGAFSQHSANYHRLMLHDYLWALRLGELLSQPLSRQLKSRVDSAGDFLFQIQDGESGRVPCYGQNDGALILPLNNCDYQDFRPVVQAACYAGTGTRCYPPGPWDEDLLWLFGPEALAANMTELERADFAAKHGGCYTVRSQNGFGFIRCGEFRHRPAQADQLHFDLWWRGENIALDSGTYSYNAPAPWNNPFAHTAYHNTVTVDGLDQMDRAGRFLWLPWVRGRVRYRMRSARGLVGYWEGEHDGYTRLKVPAVHRRSILSLPDDSWLVLDGMLSGGVHRYRLSWLLADLPHEWNDIEGLLSIQTASGAYYVEVCASVPGTALSLVRADDQTPRGWRSVYYGHREPALSLSAEARAETMLFLSVFSPQRHKTLLDGSNLRIESEHWEALLQLASDDQQPQVSSVSLSGRVEDRLEIS